VGQSATKTIAITGVDAEEHEALKRLAEALGRTLGNMGLRALRFYAKHIDEVEHELWREAAERDGA
jgi:2'-5' RNA ligase